eukprot:TRINITY_DN689_c0_g2_i9.p1 TRINITY_DN689_c0_g2~~TRINITY_DN689_c0_g2_i9.p1  ORF type:complete len:711 (-),score=251.79 TRINITY_DN689_c0_g2_i9:1370-3502(-)
MLLNVLGEAGVGMVVKQENATINNFRFLINDGCRAFHYSGHGMENSLTFEDNVGRTHDLDVNDLKTLFSAGGTSSVKFVFVSACYSFNAGQTFVEAGVPHVVAVKQQKILDYVCREFAKQFYYNLVNGKTVQDSFDIAKSYIRALKQDNHLKDPHAAAELFVLLPEGGEHDVPIFPNLDEDESLEEVDPVATQGLPPYPNIFIGRNVALYELISLINKDSTNLVTVSGEYGIGKSTLVNAMCHYLNDRRRFENVMWVDLKGKRNLSQLCSAIASRLGLQNSDPDTIRTYFLNNTGLSNADKFTLLVLDGYDTLLKKVSTTIETDDDDQDIQITTSEDDDLSLSLGSTTDSKGKGREITSYSDDGTLDFVGSLLDSVEHLKIVITLRDNIGKPVGSHVADNFEVPPLAPMSSAQVFKKMAAHFDTDELKEELRKHKFPKGSRVNAFTLLALHPVIQLMEGNPRRITLAVAKFNERSDRTLKQLYKICDSDLREELFRDNDEQVKQKEIAISDPEGKEAWRDLFGHKFEISWYIFIQQIMDFFNITPQNLKLIQNMIVDRSKKGTEEVVTQQSFNNFLKLFGPYQTSFEQAVTTKQSTWFHGVLARDEVISKLKKDSRGTFLIRLSDNHPGYFIANYVGEDAQGKKTLNTEIIENGYHKTGNVGFLVPQKNLTFDSLEAFTEQYTSEGIFSSPHVNFYNFNTAFGDDFDEFG